jgi:hypothetical protein
MSKRDPLDPKNVTTTKFQISTDELHARMEKQKAIHLEPVRQATALLEAALDKVMTGLGVDVTQSPESIHMQQEFLGIEVMEHTDERAPKLNGFFVFVRKGEDMIPYGWVGAARINSNGECFVDIQTFQDNRLEETGGIKIV